MQYAVIQRILGLMLMIFSVAMLPSILIGWWYEEGLRPFLYGFCITLAAGVALWLPVMRVRRELKLRDGFAITVLFWSVLSLFAALPLVFAEQPVMTLTDAVFESVSGFTTTGSTVIIGLDVLPRSILFWRQELQWLGGMGLVVLAVAILPMLGVGGMQLYRTETPGPIKDTKLTPRITETAKALWAIYVGLTAICAFAYWLAGMGPFDAVCHAFATLSTGGYSTHDASFGHFDSALIETVAVVFMILGGANFALHFMAWRSMSLKPYGQDSEFRTYIGILLIVSAICVGYLYWSDTYVHPFNALHHGIFQVVSMMTTTGFITASFYEWPSFLPALLIFVSFIGACAASTSGSIKVIRFMLLAKQGERELKRLVHPSARFAVKIGGRPVENRVIDGVWGFFSAYVAVFVIMLLMLMASRLDQVTAFSAVATTLNNTGPGLGDVGANFAGINDFSKWVLSVAMLLGRLEIFTLLVLFTPAFWRK